MKEYKCFTLSAVKFCYNAFKVFSFLCWFREQHTHTQKKMIQFHKVLCHAITTKIHSEHISCSFHAAFFTLLTLSEMFQLLQRFKLSRLNMSMASCSHTYHVQPPQMTLSEMNGGQLLTWPLLSYLFMPADHCSGQPPFYAFVRCRPFYCRRSESVCGRYSQ